MMSKYVNLQLPPPPSELTSFGIMPEIDIVKNALIETNLLTSILALGMLSMLKDIAPASKELSLQLGEIKELADGVFLKKNDNGVLELYIRED